MRGGDRSCRIPPRGVWLLLFLSTITVRTLAQDAPEDEARRRLSDPVSLAADRVTHWKGPDGERWVHLWGNAAILEGPVAVIPRGKPWCESATSRQSLIRSSDSRSTPRARSSARVDDPPRASARDQNE